MPKISRFFGYWIKKHCFIPKNSICTPYRYMQNKLSSLAACLPLSPSPGAGRQLPQSSLETAWSCTQHPVCIPIKEGFSMLQIKKNLDLQGLQRRRWDSNPRAGYPTTAFRVRLVTTTSIRLQSIQFFRPYVPAETRTSTLYTINHFLCSPFS